MHYMLENSSTSRQPSLLDLHFTTEPNSMAAPTYLSATGAMYTIQEVPGKGKGLIATRKIPQGTRILSEEPILRHPKMLPDNRTHEKLLRRTVKKLTPEQQRFFLSLLNVFKHEIASPYLGIMKTNALPMGGKGSSAEGGIFKNACFINHSCNNNAYNGWNEIINRYIVHAVRDIEEGEEITIDYTGDLAKRKDRQNLLQRNFAFTCTCRLCSLPPEQSEESDRRRSEIDFLCDTVYKFGIRGMNLSDPSKLLRYFDRLVKLYDEHTPYDIVLPGVLFGAAQIAFANGDHARGQCFAERALLRWTILEGEDGPQVPRCKALMQDPSKNDIGGSSKKWDTSQDDIPQGLNPKQLDDWLWRRKSYTPGQMMDLRDREMFLDYVELPNENEFHPNYFAHDDPTFRPRRHWVFLAEITSIPTPARFEMMIKDIEDKPIPLFFDAKSRGNELRTAIVRKGYTVAILYATRHKLLSEPRIRLEEQKHIKVLPLSLNSLLALSDRVQKFSTETNGTRLCHGCKKQADSMMKCARCGCFWYCSKACQTAGWNEKGHKADCKHLKDPDLKGLFLVDWNKFEGQLEFPLNAAAMG